MGICAELQKLRARVMKLEFENANLRSEMSLDKARAAKYYAAFVNEQEARNVDEDKFRERIAELERRLKDGLNAPNTYLR